MKGTASLPGRLLPCSRFLPLHLPNRQRATLKRPPRHYHDRMQERMRMGAAMLSERSLLRVPAMIMLALLVAPASLSVQAQERLGEAPAGMQIQTETAGQAEAEVPEPTPEMERRMEQVRENPEALRMRMLLA